MKFLPSLILFFFSFACLQGEPKPGLNKSYTLGFSNKPSIGPTATPPTPLVIDKTILTLEKRLNALGVENLLIKAQGNHHIVVKVSDITAATAQQIRTTLTKKARLELKLVHPDSRTLANRVAADPENEMVPGYDLKVLTDTDYDGNPISENLLVKSRAALDGSYILHAQKLYGPYEGQLDVELNNEGAKKMFDLTKKMRHGRDRLAIVLDGKVLSAPIVQSALSKKFIIAGIGSAKEVKKLAIALLNPLPTPLILEKEESFTPPLAK